MKKLKLFLKIKQKYNLDLNRTYKLSKSIYYKKKILGIPLIEYILNITKNLMDYNDNIIFSAILYNIYEYKPNVDLSEYDKDIKNICKDYYYFNFHEILNRKNFSSVKFKEDIVNIFTKVESLFILFSESLVIFKYFNKIKSNLFKDNFLNTVEHVLIPISSKIGAYKFKSLLHDELMKHKFTKDYYRIEKILSNKFPASKLDYLKDRITFILNSENIVPINIFLRYKNIGSFLEKMKFKKHRSINNIKDLYAIRLIFNNKKDCYNCLRILKKNFEVNRIKDYIKHPKRDGYKSIHLNILIDELPLEIQIRTVNMHNNIEIGGIYFIYKNISYNSKDRKLTKYLKESHIIKIEHKKTNKIRVYTSDNKPIFLRSGSTIFDFCAKLHSDFLIYFDYAIVNNKICSKSYVLRNEDVIKINISSKVTLKKEDIKYLYSKNKNLKNILNKLKIKE